MNNSEIREQLITARDEYIDLIKKELMGPGSEFSVPDPEHELISSSPLSRYSVGILFPQGDKVDQDNDESSRAIDILSSMKQLTKTLMQKSAWQLSLNRPLWG